MTRLLLTLTSILLIAACTPSNNDSSSNTPPPAEDGQGNNPDDGSGNNPGNGGNDPGNGDPGDGGNTPDPGGPGPGPGDLNPIDGGTGLNPAPPPPQVHPGIIPPAGCPTPVEGFTNPGIITIQESRVYVRNSTVQLNLRYSNALLMKVSANDNCACGTWQDYQTQRTWNLKPNQSNSVSVQFREMEGISQCTSVSVIHDDLAPNIQLTVDAGSVFARPSAVKLNYKVTDSGSGYQAHACTLNGQSHNCDVDANGEGSVLLGDQIKGTHTFALRATDNAGNFANQEIQWTITQDENPPVITLAFDPGSKFETPSSVTLVYQIDDLESGYRDHSCTLNSTPVTCNRDAQTKSGQVTFDNQTVGAYRFVVTASDQMGNSSSRDLSWNIRQGARPITQNHRIDANDKVDILLIIDNSGSMEYEQQNMAERMSTFMNQIVGLDYKIGITTTDPRSTVTWGDGKLLPLTGLTNQYVVTPSMPVDQAQRVIGQTLQRPETGNAAEQAIYATYRAIERSVSNTVTQNKGFVRADAAFAAVVISDEDESASGTKNQPQNLLNYVKSLWANKLFVWHSIITIPGDLQCLTTNGYSYGTKYQQFSQLTGAGTIGGAIIGSVCEKDYGSQLSGIADSIQAMQRVIQLNCTPVGDPQSAVVVYKDNQPYTARYQIQQNTRLVFDEPLRVGNYRLDYYCR